MSVIYEIWKIIESTGPPVLFGFFCAGLIHTFLSASNIARYLGQPGWKSIFWASLFGVPLPLCSCSVLPTAAALRQKGAMRGATTSFVISTPESGVDSIMLTYAIMDLPMTIIRPIAAFITAFIAGLGVNRWGEKDPPPSTGLHGVEKKSCCCHAGKSEEIKKPRPWFLEIVHYAYIDLINDLAYWMILGFVISGVISAWLPPQVFESWLGQGFPSMLLMLAISVPMYICATSSTPIAAVLIAKGLAPGAALVLLLAGPATNLGAIPLLIKMLGKRSVSIYILSIAVVSLLLGSLVNLYYSSAQLSSTMGISHVHGEHVGWINTISGLILFGLLIKGVWRKSAPPEWKLWVEKVFASN